jgi:hypothetical protein
MLTHIVVWKYRNDIEPEVRAEHVRLLGNLARVIAEVESLSVGPDVLKLPRSFNTGLVAQFRDRAALDAYTIHPEHVKVAAFGKTISEQVASVDFETQAGESAPLATRSVEPS